MKVLIADDHEIVRMGLAIIVGAEFAGADISEAGNAAEVLKVLKHKKIELMLMDLRMPDTDSIGLLDQALQIYPNMRVLVVSLNPERVFALRCLKAGAFGYIEKGKGQGEIRKAIIHVGNGRKYMSQDIVEQMTDFLKDGKSSDPFSALTQKEFLVVTHLVNGLGNKEICDLMNLQASTVATHKLRIYEKMNVKNVHELQQLAIQYNLT